MKFTKLALASVAAFGLAGAATADATPLVADGLDSWTAGGTPKTGLNVEGNEQQDGAGAVWFGDESEDTKVTAYDGSGVSTYSGACGHPGGLAAGLNFLKVSNSTTLWRMINPYAKVGEAGSEDWPTSFPANSDVNVGEGLYIDTLVQFTPSEDAPEPESGSKLIVWMNAESNLCVTASKLVPVYDSALESYVPTYETDSFVTTKALNVGTWYRLTVKAYDTVLDDMGAGVKHGFLVLIDGNVVSSAAAAIDTTTEESYDYVLPDEDLEADINAGKVFLSLDTASVASLAAVGFRGEGLVDDIVVTTEDPFEGITPAGIDFTLTWGNDVSAVWYSVDGGANKVTLSEVPAAAINLATAEVGDELIIGGTAADDWSTVVETTNTLAASGNAYTVTATQAATGSAAGVEDTALATWTPAQILAAFPGATPATVNAADEPYLDYQFGQDLGTLSAAPTVEITDIAENATAGWDITVKMFAGENALNIEDGGSAKTINAALKVIQADTLAGLATATATQYKLDFDSDKTDITINVTAGSFFKAFVEFADAPVVQP